MKILLISDLHGNAEAISVLPRDYDQLWVLGDLVNYGPNPREVIDFVRRHATYVIRGNHDHAIGFDTDPRCPEPYKAMAAEMGAITQHALTGEEKRYLRMLPLSISAEIHGSRFYLCHAAPTDPLFAYRPPESNDWEKEVHVVPPGCLLVGHTHLQFRRDVLDRIIVNPGSVGQPKTAAPQACFAIWHDGSIQFHSLSYPYFETIEKIRHLELSKRVKEDLIATLETGAPSQLMRNAIRA
ncbi:MAG TPA: metallophosphoesterase family protein [Bryobacteraceae bacterium]|jgi:protein phosphatase